MRAAIYARVSVDPKAIGRSVAEQEAECRAVCEREGWKVIEVFADNDRSASRYAKRERPAYNRLRRFIEDGGCDVLVTWECSRAQRDLDAYLSLRALCEQTGVLWSYSGRTYNMGRADDRFTTGLDALLAERESDVSRDRVLRSMRANAAKGRPHGRRPFGYVRVYDPTTGALVTQEPHPTEAAIVVRIFRLYLEGNGCRTVARILDAEGIRTATGKKWEDAQLRRLLTNPTYNGRRTHHGVIVGPPTWPAIIDDDTFTRVQQRMETSRTYDTRVIPSTRMLSGVARCGVCGSKMGTIHDRRVRKVYACKTKYCVTRDLEKLDAYINAVIIERFAQPDATDYGSTATTPQLGEARLRLVELHRQMDDAINQFTEGKLTAATLGKIEARLLPAIDAAKTEIRRFAFPINIDVPEDNVDQWWEGLSTERKRAILKAMCVVVVLPATKRGSRTFDPDAVRVDWR